MLRLLAPYRSLVPTRVTSRNLTTSAWKVCRSRQSSFSCAASPKSHLLCSLQLSETYRESIGLRTLIIAADDHQSQEYAKRMWYENQKVCNSRADSTHHPCKNHDIQNRRIHFSILISLVSRCILITFLLLLDWH